MQLFFNYQSKHSKVFKTIGVVLLSLSLFSCQSSDNVEPQQDEQSQDVQEETNLTPFTIKAFDDKDIISYASDTYYRYGPSIVEYDDGSMDMWISSPGNSATQWDWIRFRHSDDGINWSDESIVLRPTPGSRDQCSVCDPGIIHFGDYYYLAYTGTDDYEMDGFNNNAFVARSVDPEGPYEKWNGSSWGGDPSPIIQYDGVREGWGVGEVSFVIKNEDLYLFYTYADLTGAYTKLCKADLVEDWPLTLRYKDVVLPRINQDSLEVVYDENYDLFFGFAINNKMSEGSSIAIYGSDNGKEFTEIDEAKNYIEDHAHSIGVAKSLEGHADINEPLLVGYAYGPNWGRWNLVMQHIEVDHN